MNLSQYDDDDDDDDDCGVLIEIRLYELWSCTFAHEHSILLLDFIFAFLKYNINNSGYV
jgi:hypothetical protein